MGSGVWTGFMWLKIVKLVGFCGEGNEHLGSLKFGEFFN